MKSRSTALFLLVAAALCGTLLMRAADSADRKLNIVFGFQQRYGQGYLKARKLVADGAIGKIHMAHAHWIKGAYSETPLPPPRSYDEKMRQWTVWKDWFGDIIVETYCHGIDVLNWFLDAHPTKAYGAGGRTVDRARTAMARPATA